MIPKSLHTVTVLVAMARLILKEWHCTSEHAVYKAIEQLGYTVDADIYGLAQQAIKKLNKV